ncbi:predicted protein [Nematostella vectensis]|uniref:Uncharacterized protein n=1 Tax=Nematostella vectensis TaxID=45351 RepID=A7TCY3_NEMVE|nr:predicted protein [Nematostella vectensis]|eukprot:XP_001618176.1 hypothetical protein NEMVEDRAFT_v1g225423 [Nematostella vectensis]
MEILSAIAVAVDKGGCKGGSVLTLLHEKTVALTGDSKAQDLCLFLTQAFLVAEHGSVQKEKVTEDYNDAYPLQDIKTLSNKHLPCLPCEIHKTSHDWNNIDFTRKTMSSNIKSYSYSWGLALIFLEVLKGVSPHNLILNFL